MPPRGLSLHTYLLMMKDNIKNSVVGGAPNCYRFWYPPITDPVQKGSNEPESWYTANTWIYAWLPFYQFNHLGLYTTGTYKCHKCSCNSSITGKGFFWQPMCELGKLTWVLHHIFQFKCNPTTSTLCPSLLFQFPTTVVERFPFITCRNGPGLHQSIVQMLSFYAPIKSYSQQQSIWSMNYTK